MPASRKSPHNKLNLTSSSEIRANKPKKGLGVDKKGEKKLAERGRRSEQLHKQRKAQQGHHKKQTLVFDQSERIDFVKGFEKRKQERRERAKQEALEQDREIRKLLRQKRREALKKTQIGASGVAGNEAGELEPEGHDLEGETVAQ